MDPEHRRRPLNPKEKRQFRDQLERSGITRRDNPSRSSTRQTSALLKLGIPAAAALILVGGVLLSKSQPDSNTTPILTQSVYWKPTRLATVLPSTLPIDLPTEVSTFYPEAAQAYPLLSQGDLRGNFGHVRWFNFTDVSLNEIALKGVYEYFDKLSRVNTLYPYSDGNVDIVMGLQPISRQSKNLFIVPEDTPRAWWSKPATPRELPASTYYDIEGISTATAVRIFKEKDNKLVEDISYEANSSIAVEACQATVHVGVNRANPTFLAQEIVCNSFGRAFYDRQRGFSYSDYLNHIRSARIGSANSPQDHKHYELGLMQYYEIPEVGNIIS